MSIRELHKYIYCTRFQFKIYKVPGTRTKLRFEIHNKFKNSNSKFQKIQKITKNLIHTSIQILCSNFYITVEQQKYFILYTVYIFFCNLVSITMILISDPRLPNKTISARYHTAELQLELKLLSTVS